MAYSIKKVSFVDIVLIRWESLPIFMNWSLGLSEEEVFFCNDSFRKKTLVDSVLEILQYSLNVILKLTVNIYVWQDQIWDIIPPAR
jgi:hypothetical protein